MTINYGDLPTWLASVGTVGALGAALWQIRTERNRRHEQEARDRELARREQARRISCWPGDEGTLRPSDMFGGSSTPIELVNGSDEPVYELVFALVHVEGPGKHRIEAWKDWVSPERPAGPGPPRSTAAILPPGHFRVWVPGENWGRGHDMGLRLGAEVAFRDRDGVSWVRRSRGDLEELDKPPSDYFAQYGLPRGDIFQTPKWVG
jgi:hypothetical protein